MRELLSICLPTYNRANYLKELLECLVAEYDKLAADLRALVRIYVSDNCSTDATAQVVEQYSRQLPITSWRNDSNIGGENNFLRTIERSKGEFRWIIGDDDLLSPGTLGIVVKTLLAEQPLTILIAMTDPSGTLTDWFHGMLGRYTDFREFIVRALQTNPKVLCGITLVSCHIFRGDNFDFEFAQIKMRESQAPYSWLYAILNRVRSSNRPVIIPTGSSLVLRDCAREINGIKARASATMPQNFNLGWYVRCYLMWLAQEYEQPELRKWAGKEYPRSRVHPVAHRWLLFKHSVKTGCQRLRHLIIGRSQ